MEWRLFVRRESGRREIAVVLMAVVMILYVPDSIHGKPEYGSREPERAMPTGRALLVPFSTIHTEYRIAIPQGPESLLADSFLIAAATSLLAHEIGRLWQVRVADSVAIGMSDGEVDTGGVGSGLPDIRALAGSSGVDVVVVALACSVAYRVYQPEGWRHNTGPGYARPVESRASVRCDIRVFSREGVMLRETTGRASVRKPFLYDTLNRGRRRARREEELRMDVVRASRRFYGPPVVRALAKAIAEAVQDLQ